MLLPSVLSSLDPLTLMIWTLNLFFLESGGTVKVTWYDVCLFLLSNYRPTLLTYNNQQQQISGFNCQGERDLIKTLFGIILSKLSGLWVEIRCLTLMLIYIVSDQILKIRVRLICISFSPNFSQTRLKLDYINFMYI